jgi:hypothetical protein
LDIPFVYPPFALYVGAALSSALDLDPIFILQWLPGIVLIPVSIAVYSLGLQILKSPIAAGIATYLYVCTPRSMTWLVMGGGLTRSLGQLFLILTFLSVFALYTRGGRRFVFWSIAGGALVVLSHPEAALHTVAACALLWILKGRNRRATFDSVCVAIGVAIVTAVWWAPAIMRHGVAPFISAGSTGWQLSANLVIPLLMTFAEEPMMTVIPVLGLVGLAVCVARRDYLLPIWLVLPFVVDPRNAPTVAILPLVLMGAIALEAAILPALASTRLAEQRGDRPSMYQTPAVRLLLAYGGVYLLIMAFYAGTNLSRVEVSPANRDAMRWVVNNTPVESRFLVLTGSVTMFCDPVQEWFPVLTGRSSESTIQGYEWGSHGHFFERVADLQAIQLCLNAPSPGICLQRRASAAGLQFDHLYVTRLAADARGCRAQSLRRAGDVLLSELDTGGRFMTVYQTEDVEILRLRP